MKTMNDLFDRYRRDCLPKLAPSTQKDYERHLLALRKAFGSRAPGDIRPRDIGRFLDVDNGKQSRNKAVAVLSAVMGEAVGRWFVDGCDVNPCINVKRHDSHPRTRYISDAEFKAVYAIAPESVQLMMDLALITGQRQGDLLDLTWQQIQDEYIDITQGKTGKHLWITLTPALKEILQRAYARAPALPRHHVVRTRTGEPYTHAGFRTLWQRTMDEALKRGVIKTRFTFHDLRAKCVSDKADKTDLRAASSLAGHTNLALTQGVYKRTPTVVEPLR